LTSKAGWYIASAAILAVSLVLRTAFPILAGANAGHDDQMYVRLAASLAAGDWLGPYDNTTLAKGMGYSAFIALNSFTGIPLKVSEHLFYLSACCAFAWSARAVFGSRAAALACLAVLAFNPVLWSADSGGRVLRDGIYVSLSLWILALAIHVFLVSPRATGRAALRSRVVALPALGALGAIFWLTREEGVWLVPVVTVIVAAWVVRSWRSAGTDDPWRHRLTMAAFVAIPVFTFAAIVAAVNTVNYMKYGVFGNSEFRSRAFQQAYGALSRISHEHPRLFVPFPADARARAYAVSPAARELAPVLEGPHGAAWREFGCRATGTEPCPEILSTWFIFALRDAAAAAGHHSSGAEARAYYRTLGREINAACDQGRIECGPRSDSLAPPWRPEYLALILDETWRLAVGLATLSDMHVHMKASVGTAQERALFARMTRDAQAGDEDHLRIRGARMELAERLARAQVALLPIALPVSIAAWGVLLAISWRRREWHAGHVVVAALVVAMASRVALLGYIFATSIQTAEYVLYLASATPMALALVPCVLFLGLDMMRRSPDVPA
jgi:hypothetical protein